MSAFLYFLRGATLALAWLLALNVAATALVVLASKRFAAADEARSPAFWLALRLCPAAASIGFVALVFLPSYWRYEPRELGEAFDLTLTTVAMVAIAVLCAAVMRGVAAWCDASRRVGAWRRLSRQLSLDGATSVPAFAVDVATPIMALAGVFHPRLLITRGVLDALTDEELRAGVAHELGHWRAWDNLKRLAMRAAPDLLWLTSAAGEIEARWASAAEHAADHRACSDERARCALASALVKVARLTPTRTPIAEPISTLVDGGDIASRVQRLLDDAAPRVRSSRRWPIAIASAAAAIVCYVPLLRVVHAATEVLVQTLP
jgi:Zn-dependent protease with chaperone function